MKAPFDNAEGIDAIATQILSRPAAREVVPRDPQSSTRWHAHDYPHPLARWNLHPEYEVHLIRAGTGRYIIGDRVGAFAPGQLVLVGPNLPHHWISDLSEGERVAGRDVVLQFHGEWIRRCQQAMPELQELDELLLRAGHGIEFLGRTAERGAAALERIGADTGVGRIHRTFELLHLLSRAPEDEYRILVLDWAPQIDDRLSSEVVNKAIEYLFDNISGEVRLGKAARIVGMSESAFSRYFKAASGQTFSEMVKKLRLTQACRLLEKTGKPIHQLAQEVGYSNLSNFNRQFRERYGMTPRQYRNRARGVLAPSDNP